MKTSIKKMFFNFFIEKIFLLQFYKILIRPLCMNWTVDSLPLQGESIYEATVRGGKSILYTSAHNIDSSVDKEHSGPRIQKKCKFLGRRNFILEALSIPLRELAKQPWNFYTAKGRGLTRDLQVSDTFQDLWTRKWQLWTGPPIVSKKWKSLYDFVVERSKF